MHARGSLLMVVSLATVGTTVLLLGIAAATSSAGTDLVQLPGVPADRSDVIRLRAGEIKMYKQCVSKGTTCSYTNECKAGENGEGCANTDNCTSCTGGTNAGCTGNLEQTKCIDDTMRCCPLSKVCVLTMAGCKCQSTSGVIVQVGDQDFCSGG